MDRKQLRAKLFAPKKFKSKKINILGVDVEVRQPSLAQIQKLQSLEDLGIDGTIKLLVEVCYVPGTDEKVFEEEDIELIKSWPMDSWLKQFNDAFSELTNFDVNEAAKNLEKTP